MPIDMGLMIVYTVPVTRNASSIGGCGSHLRHSKETFSSCPDPSKQDSYHTAQLFSRLGLAKLVTVSLLSLFAASAQAQNNTGGKIGVQDQGGTPINSNQDGSGYPLKGALTDTYSLSGAYPSVLAAAQKPNTITATLLPQARLAIKAGFLGTAALNSRDLIITCPEIENSFQAGPLNSTTHSYPPDVRAGDGSIVTDSAISPPLTQPGGIGSWLASPTLLAQAGAFQSPVFAWSLTGAGSLSVSDSSSHTQLSV